MCSENFKYTAQQCSEAFLSELQLTLLDRCNRFNSAIRTALVKYASARIRILKTFKPKVTPEAQVVSHRIQASLTTTDGQHRRFKRILSAKLAVAGCSLVSVMTHAAGYNSCK